MTPDERLTKIERTLSLIQRVLKVSSTRVEVLAPVTMRRQLTVNGITIHTGNGTPEGVVIAPVGSLFLRLDGGAGTTLYVKEANTDATGWSTTA